MKGNEFYSVCLERAHWRKLEREQELEQELEQLICNKKGERE